jgi:hypothetical protein
MRCIFCKGPSDASRSVEHIVPESLGNKSNILPRGVVCDACNNYFARKIEEPFLREGALRALRFHQAVPNKRNRIPYLEGLVVPDIPARVYRSLDPEAMLVLDMPEEGLEYLLGRREGMLVFPGSRNDPDGRLVSRFLAKCALEALAQRLLRSGLNLEDLTDHAGLDPLRNHARRGDMPRWPHSARRIYDENRTISEQGRPVQTIYEYDLLITTPEHIQPDGLVRSEMYFILALFGLELAINMGGPDIQGYYEWLDNNRGRSPLYERR